MNWKLSFRKIKKVALSLTLVVSVTGIAGIGTNAYAAEAGVAQPYESLFKGDRIIDVKVTIAEEDMASILKSPLEKEYKKATVEVDGNKLDNVGFSTKGNLTLKSVAGMTDSDRYSYRLKFNKYDKSQTLLGLDKMVLNNNYSDPSYMREYLHYEALRAIGADAPLTVFVNLYINGKLSGFYTGVESVDDSYLERNFGDESKDGVLYDTEEKSYLKVEESGEYKTITKDAGTDKDKVALGKFIKALNEMPSGEKGNIESVLDVNSALQYIAANAVLGNYDSYNGDKGHNFKLYGDKSGRFSVVPWDMNMSFNGYSGGGRGTSNSTTEKVNTNATTASVDVPVLGISMESVPMINNLLKVPEYKTKYMAYVNQLVTYLKGIDTRIDGLANLIRPYVKADPTKFYTLEQFESNVAYSSKEEDKGQGGFGGNMTPPNGMTPPNAPDGNMAPPTNNGEMPTPPTQAGDQAQGPGKGFGQGGQGMGMMAAGSLKTFALNRLVNLEEQLGLEKTTLPVDQTVNQPVNSTGGIQVLLKGKAVAFTDQQPINKNGSVLVPASSIMSALGANVAWDKKTQTVTATSGANVVKLKIGSNVATVNGKTMKLQAPVSIVNNRTMVPVRLLAEAFNMKVSWDKTTTTVTIVNL
ncbi:CotH kinase family protein [Paenibacillus pini]|uniref:Copper amine oxidase-like N-terminal domain-containing protein n=1 Tax=Paenibacillus pini JCM 16418 TaxID=1236976 RepID=W7YFV4_9BACL|nr:CotH kinase family protein [Paenibacillus pini]GAF06413.1 hypothetical protein JCM16418_368 [Paenibacillus pini JCM 16418]